MRDLTIFCAMNSLVLFGLMPRGPLRTLDRALEDDHPAESARILKMLLEKAVAYGWQGNLWHCLLVEALVLSENPFSLAFERKPAARDSLWQVALADMAIYQKLFSLPLPAALSPAKEFFHDAPEAPRKRAGARLQALAQELAACAADPSAGAPELVTTRMLEHLAAFYEAHGVGQLGLGELFRVRAGKRHQAKLFSVEGRREVRLANLVGYKEQKALLRENTEAFLAGQRANNVLLYGDAGTGKSTSVQALATEYASQGLRVVELYKQQFELIPSLLNVIKGRNYRFILLLDDLSFEENEVEYKHLKAVMEGGGEAAPENVLIYATSNRRHLVKETWADRADMQHDGDIHRSDTMEEKLSLAGRFGLQIYYPNPSFEEYHVIVRELAREAGALEALGEDELRAQAAAWQVRRGNRSGRTAEQFVNSLLARRAQESE